MARCEDFPCCGHYDESTGPGGGSWCPNEEGVFPPLNIPKCRRCGDYISMDFDDPHYCEADYDYEPEEEEVFQ